MQRFKPILLMSNEAILSCAAKAFQIENIHIGHSKWALLVGDMLHYRPTPNPLSYGFHRLAHIFFTCLLVCDMYEKSTALHFSRACSKKKQRARTEVNRKIKSTKICLQPRVSQRQNFQTQASPHYPQLQGVS